MIFGLEGVQTILQCSHISIDSIRYPAVPYKPLARIDRCFRCQQFGHKAANCSHESKCYKCRENHEYNQDCANIVKRANCDGQHMAGSPECLLKISYRRENRETNQQPATSYLSSPTRLYSSVLQTMAPHVHAETKTRKMTPDRPTGQIDQSSIIIHALEEEIGRSQEVLLNRITQLEEKCGAVHDQQTALQWTIETQIVPNMSTMSGLLVGVCKQLTRTKVITLTDQQQTKIHRLRHPPTTSQVPFSPSPSSQDFSTAHPRPVCQQPSPSEVNCILSSLSSQ